jgi:hypothetical protein
MNWACMILRLACIASALWMAACASGDTEPASEDSFDRWCGQVLCDWETVGRTAPVATWHPDDLGVSLLDTDTQISRLERNSRVRCFLFDMIAHVETEARLVLQLDFNDDKSPDFEQQVPNVPWQTWPFEVHAPIEYDGVRFILRKKGEGLAVVAQLRVLDRGECAGEPLTLQDGSPCQTGDVCTSGSCVAGSCARDPVSPFSAPAGSE